MACSGMTTQILGAGVQTVVVGSKADWPPLRGVGAAGNVDARRSWADVVRTPFACKPSPAPIAARAAWPKLGACVGACAGVDSAGGDAAALASAGAFLRACLGLGGDAGAGAAAAPGAAGVADWPRLGSGRWADAADDEVWDDDSEALAQMEAREDRERGADDMNDLTFGDDTASWSHEEQCRLVGLCDGGPSVMKTETEQEVSEEAEGEEEVWEDLEEEQHVTEDDPW